MSRKSLGMILLLLSGVLVAAGTYEAFLQALANRESSGRASVVNEFGYIGQYQLGESALIDAGYYTPDDTNANDYRGSFTGKNGVNSLSDFLSDPAVQTQAVSDYQNVLWNQINSRGLQNRIGQTYQGVTITESGLLAAAHLIGAGGLNQCLNGSGSCTDANNTTALSYLSQFGGFDVSSITGNPSLQSGTGLGGIVNTNNNAQGNPTQPAATNTGNPFPVTSQISSNAAFANGAGVTQLALHDVVLSILSVAILLWAAWMIRAQFSTWRDGRITQAQMSTSVISGLTFLSLVLFIVLA